jgi:Xaa-Pro aminopeptidase
MRYDPVDPQLFVTNRRRLQTTLKANDYAVLKASKGEIGSETDYVPFRQNRDFFWATGIDEPWAVLVVGKKTATLFIKDIKGIERQWNGDRISMGQAAELSGIADVRPLSQLRGFMKDQKGNKADHAVAMRHLRSVKTSIEIDLIKRAIEITAEGNEQLLSRLKPGIKEYELEAELSYVYTKRGAKHGFEPIIASGPATCTIHYMSNAGTCRDGDLVIADVGAEYANYSADVSRTYPVNGKFSERQRQIYEAVLRVQKQAIEWLKPGILLRDNEKRVHEMIADELLDSRVLTSEGIKKAESKAHAAFPYFPHGTSHFLGLDVHDAGVYAEPLQPGTVITVEPGIYLPDEGIGVRIEDDVLITDTGAEVLSAAIPKDPDEIEALLAQR